MPSMTPGLFWSKFKDKNVIGTDITDLEATTFYCAMDTVNNKRLVGEARTNRRTTITIYSLLHGETADMVVYWYTIKPVREAYTELVSTVRTAYYLCEKALAQGCDLSSLQDAHSHLSSVLQTLEGGNKSALVHNTQKSAHAPAYPQEVHRPDLAPIPILPLVKQELGDTPARHKGTGTTRSQAYGGTVLPG